MWLNFVLWQCLVLNPPAPGVTARIYFAPFDFPEEAAAKITDLQSLIYYLYTIWSITDQTIILFCHMYSANLFTYPYFINTSFSTILAFGEEGIHKHSVLCHYTWEDYKK